MAVKTGGVQEKTKGKGLRQMKEEKNFEKMVWDWKRRISELQSPPIKSLSPEDFEALRRDKELRSKSANYRLLGENDKADALESQILDLQQKVASIKEILSKQPSGQQEILSTIRDMPDSKIYKQALKTYAVGLSEYEKVLKEIEQSEQELVKLHNGLIENAKARAGLEGQKVNLYLKLKELQKCLPVAEHKVKFPNPAPDWSHFLPDEDKIGKAYGHKPILFRN